jgi:class 3 adenylate cyclase/RecA/RadA recombinase
MDTQARCSACGVEARSGARFCDGCGAPLQRQQHPAEYKQVTVLFADIVRSMDIAAALGPERLRELMDDVVTRSGTVVRRYGGTLNQFTGDGIMALFGAPKALEDHAFRASLAALDIQAEIRALAAEVQERDGIALQLRIGLNSGMVVAGDSGWDAVTYTAIGEHVGMAQRMESAAPAGGVMLSESTARLVEDRAQLSEPQMVRIKGASEPVAALQLLAVGDGRAFRRRLTPLIGRKTEMTALEQALSDAILRQGRIIGIKGPPGIGKSRIATDATAIAQREGIEVIAAYCESHSSQIPFHAVAGLMREFFGVSGLNRAEAMAKTRLLLPEANSEDLELLDDLLGIGDGFTSGHIDPDARRRRLTTLLNAALLARPDPAVYFIDDAQWIDAVSESMLAEFIAAVPQTHALVLVTYRPEYRGALTQLPGFSEISLPPLDHSETATLTSRLVGDDPSVAELAVRIGERSAGNPFFTEEIVRDLAERGIIEGDRGAYICRGGGDVAVPATVQATIAARIDRLEPPAKRTLNAASVIGLRFDEELLTRILGDVAMAALLDAELIEPTSPQEYAFRHPLIRSVAYESQLKSSRSQLHRRVAGAIEQREPASVEKNAALIATHLEAAGDLHAAFQWHMRAGAWSTHRQPAAARMSWERAREVADRLPEDDPARLHMRIGPRTLLSATIWRVGGELSDIRFDELRELATAAGDKRSLAMGMTGLVQMLNFHGKFREASELASEYVELLESIGDPELIVAMAIAPILAKWNAGELTESLRLSQRAIDLSGGDPTMGSLIVGSPLAFMLALRASARCCLGLSGWQDDFDQAVEVARRVDKFSFCGVIQFKYIAVLNWAIEPDEVALRETAEALEIARHGADDFTLVNAEFAHGLVLVRREDTDRERGFELLAKTARLALEHRYTIIAAWCADLDVAAEMDRRGEYHRAIELAKEVLENELRCGEHINLGWTTTVLVESLLHRGAEGDLDAAQAAIDRLATLPAEPGFLYHDLPMLRLNAMTARARGDNVAYSELRDRYRAQAEKFGMNGHIAIARAMT